MPDTVCDATPDHALDCPGHKQTQHLWLSLVTMFVSPYHRVEPVYGFVTWICMSGPEMVVKVPEVYGFTSGIRYWTLLLSRK